MREDKPLEAARAHATLRSPQAKIQNFSEFYTRFKINLHAGGWSIQRPSAVKSILSNTESTAYFFIIIYFSLTSIGIKIFVKKFCLGKILFFEGRN